MTHPLTAAKVDKPATLAQRSAAASRVEMATDVAGSTTESNVKSCADVKENRNAVGIETICSAHIQGVPTKAGVRQPGGCCGAFEQDEGCRISTNDLRVPLLREVPRNQQQQRCDKPSQEEKEQAISPVQARHMEVGMVTSIDGEKAELVDALMQAKLFIVFRHPSDVPLFPGLFATIDAALAKHGGQQ